MIFFNNFYEKVTLGAKVSLINEIWFIYLLKNRWSYRTQYPFAKLARNNGKKQNKEKLQKKEELIRQLQPKLQKKYYNHFLSLHTFISLTVSVSFVVKNTKKNPQHKRNIVKNTNILKTELCS